MAIAFPFRPAADGERLAILAAARWRRRSCPSRRSAKLNGALERGIRDVQVVVRARAGTSCYQG